MSGSLDVVRPSLSPVERAYLLSELYNGSYFRERRRYWRSRPTGSSGPIIVIIIIIIVYYAEAAENIEHTHTIHAYTIKQFKHTNKNTYYVKSMR